MLTCHSNGEAEVWKDVIIYKQIEAAQELVAHLHNVFVKNVDCIFKLIPFSPLSIQRETEK